MQVLYFLFNCFKAIFITNDFTILIFSLFIIGVIFNLIRNLFKL